MAISYNMYEFRNGICSWNAPKDVYCLLCNENLGGKIRMWIPRMSSVQRQRRTRTDIGSNYNMEQYSGSESDWCAIHPTCLSKLLSGKRCGYCYGPCSKSGKCLRCVMDNKTLLSYRVYKGRGAACGFCEENTKKGEHISRLGRDAYHSSCLTSASKGHLMCRDCKEWKSGRFMSISSVEEYPHLMEFRCRTCINKDGLSALVKP